MSVYIRDASSEKSSAKRHRAGEKESIRRRGSRVGKSWKGASPADNGRHQQLPASAMSSSPTGRCDGCFKSGMQFVAACSEGVIGAEIDIPPEFLNRASMFSLAATIHKVFRVFENGSVLTAVLRCGAPGK